MIAGVWSPAQKIPNYGLQERPPILIADQQKTIHAFNNSGDANGDAIVYRSWSVEQGWSTPIDIRYEGRIGANVVVQDGLVDEKGMLHLVYFEGDPLNGSIMYISAPVTEARQVRSWSQPQQITQMAGPVISVSLTSIRQGNLTVVYSGQQDGNGIYELHSDDNGETWSSPEIISITGDTELWVSAIRTYVDAAETLHAVWSLVTPRGFGTGIFYSKMDPNTWRWDKPIRLAAKEGEDYSTTWPSIIADQNNQLMVVYQDGFPPTRMMRLSKNGGATWDPPARLFPHEGEYEHAVLLKDSLQHVHMILGNRIGQSNATHGMWHSQWEDDRWSNLEGIVYGAKTEMFDPSAPKAAISQGNVILVTWWDDTSREFRNGSWYSYKIFDIPELPTAVYPSPIPTITTTPLVYETPIPPSVIISTTPEFVLPEQSDQSSASGTLNPVVIVLGSVLPGIILVGLWIAIKQYSIRSR